ncbi:MAG TPA: MBL fold metallo-hydrolase [Pseudolabrys sp.]|nr:MBL fold metallo-hydrolase [Pseudolabrys sp.]
MVKLTRRRLFANTAAAAAATALAPIAPFSVAHASAPVSGKQAPGIYRYKVGDFEVTQILDGARTFPVPDGFVTNVSKDQAIAAAEAAYMPKGQVTIPFSPMVVNTGSKLVLVDTGNGPGAFEQTKGAVGQLHTSLAAAGIDAKAIDIVLISHFHGDHVNGLRHADGSLAFPNAEIKVPAGEWAFWMDDANVAKANGFNKNQFQFPKKAFAGLENKVTKYEAGKEVAPGITSIATPGHTPDHMSFVIASGTGKIAVQSDVTNIPSLFLQNPDWSVVFDNDAALAVQSRHKFLDMAAAEKMTVVGYHFPFPAVGHVEKAASGYRLVPVLWSPTI